MSSFIKTMVGFFMIVVSAYVGLSFAITLMEEQYSRDYHESVIAELESSDFSTSTINSITNRKNGYQVALKNVGVYEDKRVYEVTTTYTLDMPILDKHQEVTLTGYAR